MKAIWRLFSSTELTIVLAVLICLDAAWGSIVTVKNPGVFQALDQSILFKWFGSYGKTHLEVSLWIYLLIVLISLFSLNTIVCTIDRLYTITINKRPWRSFYPQIVHIGFLIALLGHLLGSAYGFRSSGHLIFKGEVIPVPYQEGLLLRLDDIETEFSPLGELEDLNTRVTLFKESKEVLRDNIQINAPLIYKGIAFYHVNQGKTTTGLILKIDREEFSVPFGGSFKTVDGNLFKLGRIIPDFAIDKTGTPFSRSEVYRNPYLEILSSKGERGWLPLIQSGTRITLNGNVIELRDYIMEVYAVMNINKDPGVGLVIAGFSVLIVGMLLLLFLRGERVELLRRS
jgi:cytochrome c biogenesis protein